MKKQKLTNKKCQIWDWDKDKECGKVAKYKCDVCGLSYCRKHYDDNGGYCSECPEPILFRI